MRASFSESLTMRGSGRGRYVVTGMKADGDGDRERSLEFGGGVFSLIVIRENLSTQER